MTITGSSPSATHELFSLRAPYARQAPSPGQGEVANALERKIAKITLSQHALRPAPPPFDILDPAVAARVSSQWSAPCEAAFEYLADNYPSELLRLVQSNALRSADLTFAAEAVGTIADSDGARVALSALLGHPSALVREGAIYGLARHLNAEGRRALRRLADSDASPGVRSAIRDVLEEP